MKLQFGKRYITKSGRVIGPLKLTKERAISFPFYDPRNLRAYTEDGYCSSGEELDTIMGAHYDSEEVSEELPSVNTVTISVEDYERLTRMEQGFKEMIQELTELQKEITQW